MTIRVLIADDHAMMREGLIAILARERNIEVVGEACSGLQAVQMCRDLEPDIVIMDVMMDTVNGIEATRRILSRQKDLAIVGLSSHTDSRYLAEMLRAGASGYVLKENAFQELLAAIQHAYRGDIYLDPKTAGIVGEMIRESDPARGSAYSLLGLREREILQLIAEGMSTPSIADYLSISPNTVETHRRNIMRKLDIHNVVELTRYAIREGLTRVDN